MKPIISPILALVLIFTTDAMAYQATTDAGRSVESHAHGLHLFLTDYTVGYRKTNHPHLAGAFDIWGRNSGRSDYIVQGTSGIGTYGATGGEKYTLRYMEVIPGRGTFFDRSFRKKEGTVVAMGIIGVSLSGARLYELFEIAESLEDSGVPTARVFSDNIRGPQVTSLKRVLIGLNTRSDDSGTTVLLSLLNNIEPGGKQAIDVTKNYSEAAFTMAQVNAIDALNRTLENMFQQYLFAMGNSFFPYTTAFVDHNGTNENSALITDPELSDNPELRKFALFPAGEGVLELPTIANDEDFKRISGSTQGIIDLVK